jgi:molybdopterin-biosynthesis enzyme MoeA-like protein
MVAGRTREDEVVVLPGGPSDFGRMVKVKLTRARQRSFLAERLDEVPGDESSEAF